MVALEDAQLQVLSLDGCSHQREALRTQAARQVQLRAALAGALLGRERGAEGGAHRRLAGLDEAAPEGVGESKGVLEGCREEDGMMGPRDGMRTRAAATATTEGSRRVRRRRALGAAVGQGEGAATVGPGTTTARPPHGAAALLHARGCSSW